MKKKQMSIASSRNTNEAMENSALLSSSPPTTIVAFGPTTTTTDQYDDTPSRQEEEVVVVPILLRHDSEFSVGTTYNDTSPNDLSAVQGAVLLVAECLGTGLLALPGDVHVLGYGMGLSFLIINLPINLAAGTVLSAAASFVEQRQKIEDRLFQATLHNQQDQVQQDYQALNELTAESAAFTVDTHNTTHTALHHDTATYDFIGMTTALFRSSNTKIYSRAVQIMYYLNIFLVLGNYILVMSHAVVAASAETLSLTTAGIVASLGMYAVSQLRTMAHLGRTASVISLLALAIVVIQCLVAARQQQQQHETPLTAHGGGGDDSHDTTSVSNTHEEEQLSILASITAGVDLDSALTNALLPKRIPLLGLTRFGFFSSFSILLRKLSAMGSIGFAVGSQKLLLNIRHELVDRNDAPWTLLYGLTTFGTVYVAIILLAGSHPPKFLLDAIVPGTWQRPLAGFMLWGHVMVSYAINSQALCASLERIVCPRFPWLADTTPTIRWMTLTGGLAVLAYTVANVIPFFADLVALIGAFTSVPLTLLLPALFWRQMCHYPLWTPTLDSLPSYCLVLYATIFMITATIGSVWSIQQDWTSSSS
jgi:hypothetical protein